MIADGRLKPGSQLKEALGVLLFLVLLVAIWQAIVVLLQVPPYLLPPPLDVATAFIDSWRLLLDNMLVTLEEIALGLSAGVLLGLTTAVVMHQSAVLGKALYVPILATQTTPVVAVAPILIVWFGVGLAPKVMIIAVFSFFPVLVNTLSGLQATGRQMVNLMESVAASQWQIYRYVRIPMALPHVFAGIRLAAAASVVGAIVVEWVSSTAGLGYLLILFQARLNVSKAFATLLLLLLLGLVIFTLFAWIERRFSWQRRQGIE